MISNIKKSVTLFYHSSIALVQKSNLCKKANVGSRSTHWETICINGIINSYSPFCHRCPFHIIQPIIIQYLQNLILPRLPRTAFINIILLSVDSIQFLTELEANPNNKLMVTCLVLCHLMIMIHMIIITAIAELGYRGSAEMSVLCHSQTVITSPHQELPLKTKIIMIHPYRKRKRILILARRKSRSEGLISVSMGPGSGRYMVVRFPDPLVS